MLKQNLGTISLVVMTDLVASLPRLMMISMLLVSCLEGVFRHGKTCIILLQLKTTMI